MRPSAKRVSSRSCRGVSGTWRSVSIGVSIPRRLSGYLQLIQNVKQGDRDGRVQHGHNDGLLRVEVESFAEQGPRQHPIKKLVEEAEEKREDQPHHGVFHFEALAHR